jgi:hypothetical protein
MRSPSVASGYTTDTQRLVAARLARIAVESNDAALARWLLDVSGTSATQTGGDAGLELGELASSRRQGPSHGPGQRLRRGFSRQRPATRRPVPAKPRVVSARH